MRPRGALGRGPRVGGIGVFVCEVSAVGVGALLDVAAAGGEAVLVPVHAEDDRLALRLLAARGQAGGAGEAGVILAAAAEAGTVGAIVQGVVVGGSGVEAVEREREICGSSFETPSEK